MKKDLKEIFEQDLIGQEVIVEGWIKDHRKQKEFGFIDFSDGTCFKKLRCKNRFQKKNHHQESKV